MSSSVPGLLSRPSWGKMQISRSMAHLYSSMRGWIPSRLRSPTTGSTSRWVRMWVVPCRMLFSRVFTARSRTSSARKFRLAFATSWIASSSVPCTDLQRSSRHDLSRWMWVSMKPEETRRPPTSISSPSAARPGSMAATRPPSSPMSAGGSFSLPAIRAFLRIRSMVSSGQTDLTSPTVAPLLHARREARIRYRVRRSVARSPGRARSPVWQSRRRTQRRASCRARASARCLTSR